MLTIISKPYRLTKTQCHVYLKWAAPLIKEGNAYFELGNYTRAIESYDKAFSLLGNLDEEVKSLNKNNGPKPYWLDIWFDKGKRSFKPTKI